jgi:hypothetical protein
MGEEVIKYAISMLQGATAARKETRLRSKNFWIYDSFVTKNIGEWVQTVLPPGKRTLGVRYDNVFYLLDRSDVNIVLGKRLCKPGNNFVCDCVGYLIYDMIGYLSQSLLNLPLRERLCKAPVDSVFYTAVYVAHNPKVPINCGSNRRLLLMKQMSPYTNFKDALSWKPVLGPGLAVLCCRCGFACSVIDESEIFLREEGKISRADKQMGCYVCRWDEQTMIWNVIREAKRGEPVYTSKQCAMSRAGVKLLDLPISV